VLSGEAAKDEKATVDRVAALTAIILDIDSGDTGSQARATQPPRWAPVLVVASGGKTDAGAKKLHLYWLFNEPRMKSSASPLRKQLAQKVGGDASFRARYPGRPHPRHRPREERQGQRNAAIVDRCDASTASTTWPRYRERCSRWRGSSRPSRAAAAAGGMMDFTPNFGHGHRALHRDVHEGGEDLTRWGEFSKVAGFNIAEARAGRLMPDAAYQATYGWMLQHMLPPWPPSALRSASFRRS
jgi:hypothetical protein